MISGEILSPTRSVVLSSISQPLTTAESIRLRQTELRWHYSQHYFAENYGEELLEDMIFEAPNPRLKNMLEVQLRDELKHAKLYRNIADGLGLDERARVFGDEYSKLVKSQEHFCEKVFAFQMLTESVAFGYVSWRLSAVKDDVCNSADQLVFEDEGRHLKMAAPLLRSCSPEELRETLSPARRRVLLKAMIKITQRAMKSELLNVVTSENPGIQTKPVTTSLDMICARALISHAKEYDAWIPGPVEEARSHA